MTNSSAVSLSTLTAAITCEDCNLGNLCIPKGLSRAEIAELGTLVSRNSLVRRGETIYHAGTTFKGIIALRSGSAKLVNIDRTGDEFIVDFTLPGELLGFDGLASQTHSCTAVALETVSYCLLSAAKVAELASKAPSLSQVLLQRSGGQLNQQVQQMILNRRTAEARVACFILRLSERLKARGYAEMEFRLSMSREEIGNYLGIAHETVCRILHQFQAQQLIKIKSKQLTITDKKKLLGFYTE